MICSMASRCSTLSASSFFSALIGCSCSPPCVEWTSTSELVIANSSKPHNLTVNLHKMLEPFQGFFDLFVGRGVAGSNVACAAGSEGRTRHHGNLFFLQ